MKTALVLSGGGMFGAWQAGVWSGLVSRLGSRAGPELVVGASVGSLNGYAIAGGATPAELCEFWMQPKIGRFRDLPATIRSLMKRYPAQREYALTLTDLLRMKPKVVLDGDVTWRHLSASCAIPGLLPQRRINGRWYSDGGLLNPLPVWAAVELGATRIIAIHCLPEIPSSVLKPIVSGFRRVFGHHPPLPDGVEVIIIEPEGVLGSVHDALVWKRMNIERWIAQGQDAGKNISIPNCFWS
jgi:predicted acylesterase/phospholipase RssA